MAQENKEMRARLAEIEVLLRKETNDGSDNSG
jgi:hypothetical protein